MSDPSYIEKIQELLKTFEEAKNKVYSWNTKVHQIVVQLFNKEIEKYKSRIIKVNSLFDINTKRNNDLINFFQILFDNYNLASKNADYYIIANLINNAKFNLQTFNIAYNSLDELYEKACSYFSSDYIISKEKAPQKYLKKQYEYYFQKQPCSTLIPPSKIIFGENTNIVCFDDQNEKKVIFTSKNKPIKLICIKEKILFVFPTGFYELSYITVPWIIEFQYKSEANRAIYDIIKLQNDIIGIVFDNSIVLFDLKTNKKISEVQNQNFTSKIAFISTKDCEIAFLNRSTIYIWDLKENISNHKIELNQTSNTIGKLDKIDETKFIAYLNLTLYIINMKSFSIETIIKIKINPENILIIDKDIILTDNNCIYLINDQDFSLQKLKTKKENKYYSFDSIDKYLVIQKKTKNSYQQRKLIFYQIENK